jgi:hypothetical protein
MLSWHPCLAGRRNFYTKPLRNVDDGRTHGLLCAALIFVRRLQLIDCGSGTEKNLPKVISPGPLALPLRASPVRFPSLIAPETYLRGKWPSQPNG